MKWSWGEKCGQCGHKFHAHIDHKGGYLLGMYYYCNSCINKMDLP